MHSPTALADFAPHEWADACARAMRFIRTAVPDRNELASVLASGMIRTQDLNRKPKTLEAEWGMEFPASVYFFAGRGHPGDAGTAACVIEQRTFHGARGAVSPFDTGGVFRGHSSLPWQSYGSPKAYVDAHSVPIDEFSPYFARFLSHFFDRATSYWRCPDRPIDGVMLGPDDEWRDWTFEIRLSEQADVNDAHWYFDNEIEQSYLDLVQDGIVDCVPDATYQVADIPWEAAERWVKNLVLGREEET